MGSYLCGSYGAFLEEGVRRCCMHYQSYCSHIRQKKKRKSLYKARTNEKARPFTGGVVSLIRVQINVYSVAFEY